MQCFPSRSQGTSANTQDYFFAPLAPVIRGEGSGVNAHPKKHWQLLVLLTSSPSSPALLPLSTGGEGGKVTR